MNIKTLFHIVPQTAWDAEKYNMHYKGDTLATEGFIHCSYREQVIATVNAYFAGRRDLLLLIVDPSHVQADIRDEDLYDSGQKYPHIYGPLNLDAVTNVVALVPNDAGMFVEDALAFLDQ